MKNLYFNVKELDLRATKEFLLPPSLLMENAARGMADFLKKRFKKNQKILIVCGSGDNGADGLATARMLCGFFKVYLYLPLPLKSPLAKEQMDRLLCLKEHFNLLENLKNLRKNKFDIVLDCLFGIGLKGDLNSTLLALLQDLNSFKAIKVACDIPSGIKSCGTPQKLDENFIAFNADFTLTMGALKLSLFSDLAKDFVGKVYCLSLGIQRKFYELESNFKLLEKGDFTPPKRTKNLCNKGSFGHLALIVGQNPNAPLLSASAGFKIGSGLCTLVCKSPIQAPIELMQNQNLPYNTTSIIIGMGFGKNLKQSQMDLLKILEANLHLPILFDADIFYHPNFKEMLKNAKYPILTPHLKEFSHLLSLINIEATTQNILENKIEFTQKFLQSFPHCTLVLKGANTLIATQSNIFINPLGNNSLAKGGSGDVLAGLIGGFLAQGYTPLNASIQGVLAHSLCARKFTKKYANFSLSPLDLISQIRYL
ncbi:NAD(P)H-hydrate dehydratase [Helicobacter burdigaliensis]|uniref:NAD(P)H-hydrate dehydratase n=1 Tax=Helicobacter burdigaliensis TaxID=2315334 RepID=UPI000EF7054C|nr:NAD(P)H-hydrate dehydratase [Helicobacter burdigaliensis]